ncbi:MAG: ABC transporter permease [Ignavibacteriae bacterium]|nr:MAG: ABC transporter permease [Ignavibacteriota bacterium]
MKQLLIFVRKEFLHVLRDRRTMLILFALPIAQILIFGFALTNEVKNARVAILDEARDELSARMIDRIDASRYFQVDTIFQRRHDIEPFMRRGEIDMVVVIPQNFESDLGAAGRAAVQAIVDASDPNYGTTLTNYLQAIIADLQMDLSSERTSVAGVRTEARMLYNPQLEGAPNFVPGVMALVLMLVCVMMTSISIVREKELGTMEILLVSPFQPLMVILAKAIPYFLLSLINVGTILALSVFVLGLEIRGSLVLLYALSMLFIITSLALGLLLSTIAKNQQAAMLMSMMGMLLPTVLFAGFMFPIENMPLPLQIISNIVPAKWYYRIVNAVMIKGVGFSVIWREVLVLVVMTVVLLTVSLRRFRVRLS